MLQPFRVAILPWSDSVNPYQVLSASGLQEAGAAITRCGYHPGLPICRALRDAQPDVLILDWVHSFYTSPAVATTMLKTLMGEVDRTLSTRRAATVIWNIHNLYRHDGLHRAMEHWSFRRLAGLVDGIRVFSNAAASSVRSYLEPPGTTPIRAIHHGNYIGWYPPATPGRDVAPPGRVSKVLNLLIFGGIRRGKGIDGFARAFQQVQDPAVHLTIAGSPLDAPTVAEIADIVRCDHRVVLRAETVPDVEVASLFDAADAVVIPYEEILTSGAAILAMSFGKPILAADLPVLREQIPAGGGVFGSLSDPEGLSSMLSGLRERDLASMGKTNHSTAECQTWESAGRELMKFAAQLREPTART